MAKWICRYAEYDSSRDGRECEPFAFVTDNDDHEDARLKANVILSEYYDDVDYEIELVEDEDQLDEFESLTLETVAQTIDIVLNALMDYDYKQYLKEYVKNNMDKIGLRDGEDAMD